MQATGQHLAMSFLVELCVFDTELYSFWGYSKFLNEFNGVIF